MSNDKRYNDSLRPKISKSDDGKSFDLTLGQIIGNENNSQKEEMYFFWKFVRSRYIKRMILGFSLVQFLLLLSFANIWILSSEIDNKTASVWGGLRIFDLMLLPVSGFIYLLLGNGIKRIGPSIVVFGMGMISLISQSSILISFYVSLTECYNYSNCVSIAPNHSACGDPAPLCLYAQYKNTTNFYIFLAIVTILVDLGYTIIIGGYVFAISTERGRELEAKDVLWNENKSTYKSDDEFDTTVQLKKITLRKNEKIESFQLGLNVAFAIWVLLIIEICVLTASSVIKIFFIVHIFHLWSVGQVQFSFRNYKQQKYAFWENFFATFISSIGVIASAVYLSWNCNGDSSQMFINTQGCEITLNGARYILVLNLFPMLLGPLRIIAYHLWLSNFREQQTYSNSMLIGNSESNTNGTSTRFNNRKRNTENASKLQFFGEDEDTAIVI